MKFLDTLKSLGLAKQIALGAAMLGVVMAMAVMIQGSMRPQLALLYSGLDAGRSGEVIEALEQRKIAYEVRGEAIYIPQPLRDELRLSLAKDGLPRQTIKGYELLDDVNGFSVTSEMYNASYFRAKEGELTRTILSVPGVEAARVHIGASLRSGLSRQQVAQTASVTISTSRSLSRQQAESIQYLVALAVSGLRPEDVVVIDPASGILAGPNAAPHAQLEVAAQTEAATLEGKILKLLEARVGAGNVRVTAAVEVVRELRRTSEVKYDPSTRTIRNRSINESTQSSLGGGGGVTVASNLPQNQGGAGAAQTEERQNSSETVDYAINEVRTETEYLPGQVQRVSIAVLLNEGAFALDPAAPDFAQAIEAIGQEISQLVTSAAGLDAARGDLITVEVMPFAQAEIDPLIERPGLVEQLLERHFWSGLQAALLGLVVIALGFGVVRPILMPKAALPSEPGDADSAVAGPEAAGSNPISPFDHLRDYSRQREAETAALLQDWLSDDRKVAVNE